MLGALGPGWSFLSIFVPSTESSARGRDICWPWAIPSKASDPYGYGTSNKAPCLRRNTLCRNNAILKGARGNGRSKSTGEGGGSSPRDCRKRGSSWWFIEWGSQRGCQWGSAWQLVSKTRRRWWKRPTNRIRSCNLILGHHGKTLFEGGCFLKSLILIGLCVSHGGPVLFVLIVTCPYWPRLKLLLDIFSRAKKESLLDGKSIPSIIFACFYGKWFTP